MSEHKYRLKYDIPTIEFGEFSKEEIKNSGKGGADALFFASLIFPEDGSLSTGFFSYDGRNGGKDLEVIDHFRVLGMLLGHLEDSDLTGWQKQFVQYAMDLLREQMSLPPKHDWLKKTDLFEEMRSVVEGTINELEESVYDKEFCLDKARRVINKQLDRMREKYAGERGI